MTEILVKADIDKVTKEAGREVTVTIPDILEKETLAEITAIIGEDLAYSKLKSQIKSIFTGHIRNKLEAKDKEGEFTKTIDEIATTDYSTWIPEVRVRTTKVEKASNLLKDLDDEQLKLVLANAGIDLT